MAPWPNHDMLLHHRPKQVCLLIDHKAKAPILWAKTNLPSSRIACFVHFVMMTKSWGTCQAYTSLMEGVRTVTLEHELWILVGSLMHQVRLAHISMEPTGNERCELHEMTPRVNAFVSNKLSSVPGTHTVKRTNFGTLTSDLHIWTTACTFPPLK